MLEPLSPPLSAGALFDPRLKILWIEDVQKGHHAKDIDLGEIFSIFLARTPGDIADELPDQRSKVQAVRERGLVYDLDRFPFDGYFTDYDLSRIPDPPVSGQLPDYPEDADSMRHVINVDPTPTEDAKLRLEAIAAEAAGLTSGVLTAVNFEAHPAVIVPYTGHEEQLGRQRALVRLLTTDNLVFAQDSLLKAEFSKPQFRIMAEIFSKSYREALPFWAARGIVHLTLKEKARLKKMVAGHSNGDADRIHWKKEVIVLETEYQRRRILLGSLWFRKDQGGTAANEILLWIDQFPAPSTLFQQARILADRYWEMSNRPESEMRHDLSKAIEDFHKHSAATTKPDALHLERLKNVIRKHCDRLMINWEDALQPDTKLEVAEPGFGGVRHLMVCGESKDACRLAVLMILVMEYMYRCVLLHQELSEELRPFFEKHVAGHPPQERMTVSVEKMLKWKLTPEAMQAVSILLWMGVKTLDYEVCDGCLEEPRRREVRIPQMGPPRPEDLHRRLDPLPTSLVTKWDTVEKSLSRREKASPFLKLNELIANGEDTGLRPEEQRELQRFAREIEFPRSFWPDWLTSNIRTSKIDEAGGDG